MRLESVKLLSFRGIREGEASGFEDVNILVGRNNAGKSTLAEAICRALVGSYPDAKDAIGRRVDAVWDEARADPSRELSHHEGDETAVEVLLGRMLHHFAVKDGGVQAPRSTPVGPNGHKDASAAKAFAEAVTVFRPRDMANDEIERKLWQKLLKKRADKALVSALNDIFGCEVEQLQVLPDQQMTVLFPDHALSLDVQGDGMRSALRCLMVLTALKKTLFVLEEPETNQHPGSLERFALALCKLAKQQEVQLLVTTHSAECVSAFMSAADEASSSAALYHLQLNNGVLDARVLTPSRVKQLLDSGTDVRFLDLYT